MTDTPATPAIPERSAAAPQLNRGLPQSLSAPRPAIPVRPATTGMPARIPGTWRGVDLAANRPAPRTGPGPWWWRCGAVTAGEGATRCARDRRAFRHRPGHRHADGRLRHGHRRRSTPPSRPAYDYLAAFGGSEREPAVDFALTAAAEALHGRRASLGLPAERWGVAFGSCNGGLRSAEKLARRSREGTTLPDDALHYLLVPPQAIAEALSAAFALKGPALSVNTACASGAHAIAHAADRGSSLPTAPNRPIRWVRAVSRSASVVRRTSSTSRLNASST